MTRRASVRRVLLLTLLLPMFQRPGFADTERRVPPVDALYSAHPQAEYPMCVNARRLAEGPNGPVWQLLPDYLRERLAQDFASQERYRQEAEAKGERFVIPDRFTPTIESRLCVTSVLTSDTYNDGSAPQSFAGLVAEAEGIVEGRIVAIRPMLCHLTPVSLLEVEAEHVFRTSPRHARGASFLVYHPFARFAFGGQSFCNALSVGHSAGRAFEPALGGRVLLFVFGEPTDRDHRFLLPRPEQIVYQSPGGELGLPPLLRRDDETHPARTFDEVEDLLVNALRIVGRPDDDLGDGGRERDGSARKAVSSGGEEP